MRPALAFGVLAFVACGSFDAAKDASVIPDGGEGGVDGGAPATDAGGAGDADATAADDRPLAHWKLDETTGDEAADALGGNPGIRSGGAWLPGHIGGAFSTGGSGCIQIPLTDSIGVRDRFSVSVWVNLQEKTSGDSYIFTHGGSFYVKLNSRYPQLSIGSGVYYNTLRQVSADAWHHIAVTFDAGTPAIYVDGIVGGKREDTMSPTTRPAPATDPIWIGCGNGGGSNAIGLIDDVRYYGRVLTPDEIKALAAQ